MSGIITDNLIEQIKAKQIELGLSESEFAKKLGISRALWFLIKKGERQPGFKFIQAIIKKFPDLQLAVYQYLARTQK